MVTSHTHTHTYIYIYIYIHIQPGGWETALVVKHFLKRNSSGAVAPYTFYDEHDLKFCRSKLNDFEGMSWYLQGFVVVAAWNLFSCSSVACHFSKRLLRALPVRLRKSVEFPWCHRHPRSNSVASTYVRKVHER